MIMISAFVLAGGKSTRMGVDKASLWLDSKTLLEIAIEKARCLTAEARVVGPQKKFGPQAIEDIFPERGPLGGIHAALQSSTSELNLILAVDMPFIETGFLEYLLREAARSPAAVTVPRSAQGWQPLCAVYRQSFHKPAERALLAGQNKIDALFPHLQIRVVEEEEITRAGFAAKMFDNLNTPQDWARVAKQS